MFYLILRPPPRSTLTYTLFPYTTHFRSQNVEVAAGSVGRQPNPAAAQQVALDVKGLLATEEEFAAIVVKTGADGQLTRLGEVARSEMGANDYALRWLLDSEHAIALQILQSPGANALDTAAEVRRSEGRGVGKECVCSWSTRGLPY